MHPRNIIRVCMNADELTHSDTQKRLYTYILAHTFTFYTFTHTHTHTCTHTRTNTPLRAHELHHFVHHTHVSMQHHTRPCQLWWADSRWTWRAREEAWLLRQEGMWRYQHNEQTPQCYAASFQRCRRLLWWGPWTGREEWLRGWMPACVFLCVSMLYIYIYIYTYIYSCNDSHEHAENSDCRDECPPLCIVMCKYIHTHVCVL